MRDNRSELRLLPVAPESIARIENGLLLAGHTGNAEGPLFRTATHRTTGPLNPIAIANNIVKKYGKGVGIALGAQRPQALRATAATNVLEHQARHHQSAGVARTFECFHGKALGPKAFPTGRIADFYA